MTLIDVVKSAIEGAITAVRSDLAAAKSDIVRVETAAKADVVDLENRLSARLNALESFLGMSVASTPVQAPVVDSNPVPVSPSPMPAPVAPDVHVETHGTVEVHVPTVAPTEPSEVLHG